MANNVATLNGVAITDIDKVNGITDANLQALNGEEFTGTPPDSLRLLATPLNIPVTGDATAVATVDITSGIDSTYDEYQFHFIHIHPATSATILSFQVDTGTNTNYNQPITSTALDAENPEADSNGSLQYRTNRDQVNGTNYQQLGEYIVSSNADQSASGVMTLYAPASATYVKQWNSVINSYGNTYSQHSFHGGYINTATAITRIRFVMTANDMSASGNIDAGIIKMYGVIK
jgi:hypothetical protein